MTAITAIQPPGRSEELKLARRDYRLFRRLALATLILSCAIALSLNLVDPDLWGHVLYGQELLDEGKLPTTATHTFTAQDHRWINHENLAEIALAVGFARLGGPGMLVLKCLWGLAILGLMVWVARRHGVDPLVAWAVMLLISHNLVAFFVVRPQLFSFMWFALLLVLLELAFEEWDDCRVQFGWLWLAPPLFLVWANSHGAFLAGLCIFVAFLSGKCIECAIVEGRQAVPIVKRLAGVAGTSLLATLVNPYGYHLPLWLVSSLGQPRPEITEWAPPSVDGPLLVPLLLLIGLAVVSFAVTGRRRDWTQIAILVLVTFQATSHLRHIAFLALLCGFWLPPHLQSALERLRPKDRQASSVFRLGPRVGRMVTVALAAAVALSSIGLFDRLSRFPVRRDRYPVDALQYMVDHGLEGKLVVSFNWAQYAIAALAPDVQVAFDGRFRTCYPQELVDMHFDFLLGGNDGKRHRSKRSGPIDGRRVLEFGEPNLVLVDKSYPESVRVMQRQAKAEPALWTLLHEDPTAQLWGRRDLYDDPISPWYIEPERRVQTDQLASGDEPWPALPISIRHDRFALGRAPRTVAAVD